MKAQSPRAVSVNPYRRPVGSLHPVVDRLADVRHESHVGSEEAHRDVVQTGVDTVASHGEYRVPVVTTTGPTELNEVRREDRVHVVTVESSLRTPERLFEAPQFLLHPRTVGRRAAHAGWC